MLGSIYKGYLLSSERNATGQRLLAAAPGQMCFTLGPNPLFKLVFLGLCLGLSPSVPGWGHSLLPLAQCNPNITPESLRVQSPGSQIIFSICGGKYDFPTNTLANVCEFVFPRAPKLGVLLPFTSNRNPSAHRPLSPLLSFFLNQPWSSFLQ